MSHLKKLELVFNQTRAKIQCCCNERIMEFKGVKFICDIFVLFLNIFFHTMELIIERLGDWQ